MDNGPRESKAKQKKLCRAAASSAVARDELKPSLAGRPVPTVAVAPHRLLHTLGDGLLHTPMRSVAPVAQGDVPLEALHDEVGVLGAPA